MNVSFAWGVGASSPGWLENCTVIGFGHAEGGLSAFSTVIFVENCHHHIPKQEKLTKITQVK
jgi:hypothetical protein